jgi:hypothetical protein
MVVVVEVVEVNKGLYRGVTFEVEVVVEVEVKGRVGTVDSNTLVVEGAKKTLCRNGIRINRPPSGSLVGIGGRPANTVASTSIAVVEGPL